MERLGADSRKTTLNICIFRNFLLKLKRLPPWFRSELSKRVLRKYLPFPELEGESILRIPFPNLCGICMSWGRVSRHPFPNKLRKPHCRVFGTPQQGQSDSLLNLTKKKSPPEWEGLLHPFYFFCSAWTSATYFFSVFRLILCFSIKSTCLMLRSFR